MATSFQRLLTIFTRAVKDQDRKLPKTTAVDTTHPTRKWFSSSWLSFSDRRDRDPERLPSSDPPRQSGDTKPTGECLDAPVAVGPICKRLDVTPIWPAAVGGNVAVVAVVAADLRVALGFAF